MGLSLNVSGLSLPTALLAEKGRGNYLTTHFALVCPTPEVVWPSDHHNLGSKGDV